MKTRDITQEAIQAPLALAMIALGAAAGCGIYAVLSGGAAGWIQVLWCIALWATGSLCGFLFAIPRVVQPTRPAPAVATSRSSPDGLSTIIARPADAAGAPINRQNIPYQLIINTNLEEISDWLTKIIIGMTLIQLKEIPSEIDRLAELIGRNLPTSPDHRGFATAIVVLFTVLGFLFGYLVTRLYVQRVMARVERSVVDVDMLTEFQVRLETAKLTEQTLRAVLAVPGAGLPAAGDDMVELSKLSRLYASVNIPDWATRVAEKDRLAAEMVRVVHERHISRDMLAEQEEEGLLMALAASSLGFPEPNDLARLLKVVGRVRRLHVKFRIVLAFRKLSEKGLVPADHVHEVMNALAQLEHGADEPLRERIESVRKRFMESVEL